MKVLFCCYLSFFIYRNLLFTSGINRLIKENNLIFYQLWAKGILIVLMLKRCVKVNLLVLRFTIKTMTYTISPSYAYDNKLPLKYDFHISTYISVFCILAFMLFIYFYCPLIGTRLLQYLEDIYFICLYLFKYDKANQVYQMNERRLSYEGHSPRWENVCKEANY